MVAAYDMSSEATAPQVEVYYNSAATSSSNGYSLVKEILDQYESSLVNKFHVNWDGIYDLATQEDATGFVFSSMMPMLLLIFLFSGCMAVAPEAIAGEKERGTIATLLITPAKRGSIALGKIMALSVIALLAGASSAIGSILSLPKLMALPQAADGHLCDGRLCPSGRGHSLHRAAAHHPHFHCLRLCQVHQRGPDLCDAHDDSGGLDRRDGHVRKRRQSRMVLLPDPPVQQRPVYVGIFAFSASPLFILTTVATNLVLTGCGVFLLTRMFNSERIIFSR